MKRERNSRSLTCPASAKKSAAPSYRAKGRQTLKWDFENRLSGVYKGNTLLESYFYDDSGQRAEGDRVTKCYYFNGQRIAMVDPVIGWFRYLHTDMPTTRSNFTNKACSKTCRELWQVSLRLNRK